MRRVWTWFVDVDRVLRGEATRVADLTSGTIQVSLGITNVLVLLGMIYGVCMGTYAVVNFDNGMQMVASTVKVPALFILTLFVTFPSLYVFNALVGSRLHLGSLLKLFIAALGVNLAVLSSLGPIVAFFSVNTSSYGFMVLLNVVVFAIAGLLSLVFLLQSLHRLHVAPRAGATVIWKPEPLRPALKRHQPQSDESEMPAAEAEIVEAEAVATEPLKPSKRPVDSSPLDRLPGYVLGRHVRLVFFCWMVLFGVVGAQMSWVLRPFIGAPDLPFEWFRARESNFFEAVWRAYSALFQ